MLFKNVASQGIYLFARDTVAGTGKTGDSANITAYVSKDGASLVETATGVAEVDSGLYWLALSQAETNCNAIGIVAESVTANVVLDPISGLTTAGTIPMSAYGATGGLPTWNDVAAVDDSLATSAALADVASDVTSIMGAAFVEGTHALDQSSALADMADAVLDELITGHATSDSVGAAFTTILASSSLTVDEIADGVLDELVTSHTTANSLGSVVRSRYWAKLVFVPGDTTDQYRSIRWYKGDEPLDSGVTSPLIRVISADTGTDLIAETALSEAGTSHLYLYDGTDTELTTAGKAYTVRMKATIDSAVRTFEGGIVKPAS